jgi:hypothetical protein
MPIARRLSLLLAAVVALAAPADARAGSYVVHACGSEGINGSWWASASPGLTAYSSCPAADYDGMGTGVVARSTQNGNGGSVGPGAGAWQEFDAPAGAGVGSISFQTSSGRPSGCWAIGLYGWSDGQDPNWNWHAWGYDADCNSAGGGWSYYVGPYELDMGGVGHVRMGIRCDSWGGCPTTSSIPAWANLKDVAVTVVDGTQPSVTPTHGELWSDGWVRGSGFAWSSMSDNVGIRWIEGEIDGRRFGHRDLLTDADWPDSWRCDYTHARPCNDIPIAGFGLDTAGLDDGAHRLRLIGTDAAGNSGAHEHVLKVDNHAPAPPRDVAVAGGDGWRRNDGFDVGWVNPPDQAAPIGLVHWRLCRADAPADCRTGEWQAQDVRSLRDLRAGTTGDYVLTLWLEDEAGNADAALASDPIHLRLDDVAPRSPGFDPPDPGDPRRLALAVDDEGSGVVAATIQLRPRAGGEWRSLPTQLDGGRAWTQVPDLELPDGAYEARGIVRDGAGNETTVTGDVLGRPAGIVLPVRTPTRFGGDARLRLRFGRAGRLRGALVTQAARPVAGARVSVLQRVAPAAGFRRVGDARTDAGGRFVYAVPAGPSRTVRFAFDGDDLLLPALRDARVLVPAAISLRANRRLVRNGGSVVFDGRLLGRPGGRTVDLQAHYRGAWRTFATPRADRRGRFRYVYRFGATVGRVLYRFRVLAKRQPGYPYEPGHSRTVSVTVVG